MHKHPIYKLANLLSKFFSELSPFLFFFYSYIKKKILILSVFFEKNKNTLVKLFTIKRGRYNRSFLHFAAMVVLGIGVLLTPFLASTYPVFLSSAASNLDFPSQAQSIVVGEDVFKTDVSQKPRDKIIIYMVERGDTISTIARKFGISEETVKLANDLTNDNITVGDELRILPVTGISYKVVKGDTVFSIAKRFDTDPQKIVDFPFNDFANPETFSLVEGQILIVPDGIKPSEKPSIRREVYLVQGPVSVSSAGFTWPVRGYVSQFASWYHMAIDIISPFETPIVSAQNGRVTKISTGTWDGGYGNNVVIDNGAGYQTLYAHMSNINVSIGQEVVSGKTVIGGVGNTGRSTGAHVHLEIIKNGVRINPLPYLQ